MSTFTLTLDSGDFPRASDFFTALAAAFAVFKGLPMGGDTRAATTKFLGEAPPEIILPPKTEAPSAPAADAQPASEPKQRKPRAPKAEAPPVEQPAPAAGTKAEPAPAAGTLDSKSDDELLDDLRALGNRVIEASGGPEKVVAILKGFGVGRWPQLNREQRIEAHAKLSAVAAGA